MPEKQPYPDGQNGHPPAQPENFVLFVYDEATSAFSIQMHGKIPRPALVNVLEVFKFQHLQAQATEAARLQAQAMQQKSLLLPDGTPFRG